MTLFVCACVCIYGYVRLCVCMRLPMLMRVLSHRVAHRDASQGFVEPSRHQTVHSNTTRMDIKLHVSVIIDVNHNFEMQVNKSGSTTIPLCYLLFARCSEDSAEIVKGVPIPIEYDNGNASLTCNSLTLQTRIRLIQTTTPDLSPYGVLLVNHDLNDYHEFLIGLRRDLAIEYYFTYSPSVQKLQLRCYCDELLERQVAYQIVKNDAVTLAVSNAAIRTEAQQQRDDWSNEQVRISKHLIQEIDKVVSYLQSDHVTDEILRKVSLLVSELKKPVTEDIKQELLSKEIELQSLRLLCEQWETLQSLGTYIE